MKMLREHSQSHDHEVLQGFHSFEHRDNIGPHVVKILEMQNEIDKVKEFQYQYCTSDKNPERNYYSEIAPSSELSVKSEIFF